MIVFSDISTDYRFGTRASGTYNVPSWDDFLSQVGQLIMNGFGLHVQVVSSD